MPAMSEERKLATIRRISTIEPIENADAIEVATVDGWKVVVKKGEYKVGDLIIYFEIDSWIPHELAPFLTKSTEPREYLGIKGERLRTVKLRGQISQGLILPLSHPRVKELIGATFGELQGFDLTGILGIEKYEKPLSAELSGVAKGSLPFGIPKTDEARIQNLSREVSKWNYRVSYGEQPLMFEVSEKLDGSSMTVYWNDGTFGVCSRNLDLLETEGNTFWNTAKKLDLKTKLDSHGVNLAIQGELVGPGVQKNYYKLDEHRFYVFRVYLIAEGRFMTSKERMDFVKELRLHHVPILGYDTLSQPTNEITIEGILTMAEGSSAIAPGIPREGLVFKEIDDPDIHFKAISNSFLLKEKD